MPFPPTDWGDWTEDEYEVGAPATSGHFERWFRNVVAQAQGAGGAPRNQPRSLATYAGRADLPTGAGSPTPVAFVDLDPQAVLLVDCFASTTTESASLALQLSVSNDGGTSWSSWLSLELIGGENGRISGTVQVDLAAGTSVGSTLAIGAFSFGIEDVDSIRFRAVTTGAGGPVARVLLRYIGEAL
ncbi:hypothetical protein [Neotabrizicola sp. VNH66]|uniref:hypothetical protein n=1 Tax=Neotabrizicola sp. VNH66 TaxID=3400918 RepID=UPI003BFE0A66